MNQYILLTIELIALPIIAFIFWKSGKGRQQLIKQEKQTRQQAQDIISRAGQQATAAMINTENLTGQSINILTNHLKDSMTDLLKNIEAQFAKEKEESLQSLKELSRQQIEKFSQELIKATVEAKQAVDSQGKLQFNKIQKELDLYKKQKMEKVDAEIKTLVNKIAAEVLNKSISLKDHEKLILQSLEQAGKEGLFR